MSRRAISAVWSAARSERMGSEIAGDSDEDMPALVGIAPLAELPHARVQRLVGMETCVLAQQCPRQRDDQHLHRVTERQMTRDETRGEIDLSLPIDDPTAPEAAATTTVSPGRHRQIVWELRSPIAKRLYK